MKAEFLKDDNGNIWFYYAKCIQTRSRLRGQHVNTIEQIKLKTGDAEDKQEVFLELQEYQQENNL